MDSRMTVCDGILGELVAYQLGTTTDDERERVDAHLIACTSCLRAYLRLKHHVARGASAGVRPSDATRRRIREDVAQIVRPGPAARVREILRRPIPLYQGLAVAAVAAGLAFGLPSILEDLGSKPPTSQARVDTSRPAGEALAVY